MNNESCIDEINLMIKIIDDKIGVFVEISKLDDYISYSKYKNPINIAKFLIASISILGLTKL